MTDQARELTLARGNLNVYRTLANAEKVFTGWMLAGRGRPDQPGAADQAARTRRAAHGLSDGLSLRAGPAPRRRAHGRRQQQRDQRHYLRIGLASRSISCDANSRCWSLTTELLTTRSISDAVFDQVHRALGSEATVEVLMVINRYSGLALMLNALDVDLDESARLPDPAETR